MFLKRSILSVGTIAAVVFSFNLSGCIDPVEPEFEYREGLVFIEGLASTVPGASFVIINESAIEFGVYGVKFVKGASVEFENAGTGQTVSLIEVGGAYQTPQYFSVSPGEQWKMKITLANGKNYESTPELVLDPVPITKIEVDYDPELVFRESDGGKFLPGHSISVDFEDPGNQENYYYWTYRSFENLDFCNKCREGILRDGECMSFSIGRRGNPYFDYACEVECWQIRFPESISIFEDKFSNGKSVSKLPIGDVLLYTKENIVVEVQQFSLTPAAYDYYKILKDIVDNNGGLNAPPPAALIGNLINSEDNDEFVFGRFTAAATSVASIFIDRSAIEEIMIENREPIIVEPQIASPYPPPATITAPCSETKFRTAIQPIGWIEL